MNHYQFMQSNRCYPFSQGQWGEVVVLSGWKEVSVLHQPVVWGDHLSLLCRRPGPDLELAAVSFYPIWQNCLTGGSRSIAGGGVGWRHGKCLLSTCNLLSLPWLPPTGWGRGCLQCVLYLSHCPPPGYANGRERYKCDWQTERYILKYPWGISQCVTGLWAVFFPDRTFVYGTACLCEA